MKSFMKLAALAIVFVQPLFAAPAPGLDVPDAGATAVLTLISVGGMLVGKKFLKK